MTTYLLKLENDLCAVEDGVICAQLYFLGGFQGHKIVTNIYVYIFLTLTVLTAGRRLSRSAVLT